MKATNIYKKLTAFKRLAPTRVKHKNPTVKKHIGDIGKNPVNKKK